MQNEKTTKKEWAVVTGASSGIGLELARVLATQGYDLIIAAENDEIHEAARELESLGVRVQAVQIDLSTHDGNDRLADEAGKLGGPIGILALNAGIGIHGDFVRDVPLEDSMRLIGLNVMSPVHLTKRLAGEMVKRGSGRILFTSSVVSVIPGPFESVYAASKAFVQSFAQAIRNELKDTGVTVTSLMPGATDTNFFERAGLEDTKLGAMEKDDAAQVAQEGIEAMMAGKDHVVAGSFKNKAQVAAAKVLSEPTRAKLHRAQSEPGSDKKVKKSA